MELLMRYTADHIADYAESPLAAFSSWMPWELTAQAAQAVEQLLPGLDAEYEVSGTVAVHPLRERLGVLHLWPAQVEAFGVNERWGRERCS
jgi:hypothetical protein